MSRIIPCLSLFAVLAFCPGLSASGEVATEYTTVPEIVTAMEGIYGSTESIQADFVQVTRSAAMGDEQRQKGRMSLERPRKMRWDFTSPQSKLFVTDGNSMWIWSPAENQVIVYQGVSNTGNSGINSILTDLGQVDDLFDIQLATSTDAAASYVLELVPKASNTGVKHLTLYLNRRKLLVDRVIVTDQFDTVTDLTFSQMRLNPALNDADFTFSIPAGAQVISPDGM